MYGTCIIYNLNFMWKLASSKCPFWERGGSVWRERSHLVLFLPQSISRSKHHNCLLPSLPNPSYFPTQRTQTVPKFILHYLPTFAQNFRFLPSRSVWDLVTTQNELINKVYHFCLEEMGERERNIPLSLIFYFLFSGSYGQLC